ncbi:hypothetical protein [Marinicella sp. W31]|uniref:hypothetical protein n=1 Tax=Marinicella sp. W31 TaxID=3023713 RepID=UPI003757760B
MKKLTMSMGLLLAAPVVFAGNLDVVSVGPGVGCDYATIQEGIDNSNEISLHVTNTQIFRENLELSGLSDLNIVGGFDNCSDAESGVAGVNGYTIISGDLDDDGVGEAAVMQIEGEGNISLRNFQIVEGLEEFSPFGHNGGGLSLLNYEGGLNLDSMYIANNQGHVGGGISINGGDVELEINDNVLIVGNLATQNGGGIWCRGSNEIIFKDNAIESGVAVNTSQVDGGGVYLMSDCSLSMSQGRFQPLDGDFRGIAKNKANRHGGGVYMASGAQLALVGNNNSVVNVSDNIADDDAQDGGDGGGIYATGENTLISASNVYIGNNTAVLGGGVRLGEAAVLFMARTSKQCWNQKHCNLFSFNVAGAAGAIYAENESGFLVTGAVFEDNRAQIATTVFVNSESIGVLGSSVVSHNGRGGINGFADLALMGADDGSILRLGFNTITDNDVFTSVISAGSTQPVELQLVGNIIHNDENDIPVATLADNTVATSNCMILHELNSLNGTDLTSEDPLFVNPELRDYHLQEDSPAIDRCSTDDSGNLTDMDHEAYGWDDPFATGEAPMTADIGADETYISDVIFKNSFEELL